jgi:SNF2 family DNA or RNA helicase
LTTCFEECCACCSPYALPVPIHRLAAFKADRAGLPDLLASTLVDARVDLNPHQVEAALFAFRSPLSQGVILADEVGLGKTIEAGLVIAQRWAERKRRILIITPANLRKQWHQELQDKFSLQALILEAKSYKEQRKAGCPTPLTRPQIRPSQPNRHLLLPVRQNQGR